MWARQAVNGMLTRLIIKTDNNGNAMFQSYLSKLFKKETGSRYARTAAMGNTVGKSLLF